MTLPAAATKTVIFFGDSLTAGYGLDPDEAFPSLIQKKIDAAGIPAHVVNAGLSGETTAGGLRRLNWILRQKIDVFIIELGANDGLRGIAPEVTRTNLQTMIDRVRMKYPHAVIVLAGMQLPTNLGPEYTQKFAAIFPELAKSNHLTLIPFLLAGVGGVASLNQGDGMHPTAQGDQIVADNVWKALKPLLIGTHE
ncbi:MAG TPA: arylesterase [Lacunisphaera sp.]